VECLAVRMGNPAPLCNGIFSCSLEVSTRASSQTKSLQYSKLSELFSLSHTLQKRRFVHLLCQKILSLGLGQPSLGLENLPLQITNFSFFSFGSKKISLGRVKKSPGYRRVGLYSTAGQKYVKMRLVSYRLVFFPLKTRLFVGGYS